MRFEPEKCEECGGEPIGTLETLPGLAELEKQPDGSYEYGGYTRVYWDGQTTDMPEPNVVILCCDNGHEWNATLNPVEVSR